MPELVLESDGELLKSFEKHSARMPNTDADSKRSPETGDLLLQVEMVAGACNQRYLQLWGGAA